MVANTKLSMANSSSQLSDIIINITDYKKQPASTEERKYKSNHKANLTGLSHALDNIKINISINN